MRRSGRTRSDEADLALQRRYPNVCWRHRDRRSSHRTRRLHGEPKFLAQPRSLSANLSSLAQTAAKGVRKWATSIEAMSASSTAMTYLLTRLGDPSFSDPSVPLACNGIYAPFSLYIAAVSSLRNLLEPLLIFARARTAHRLGVLLGSTSLRRASRVTTVIRELLQGLLLQSRQSSPATHSRRTSSLPFKPLPCHRATVSSCRPSSSFFWKPCCRQFDGLDGVSVSSTSTSASDVPSSARRPDRLLATVQLKSTASF